VADKSFVFRFDDVEVREREFSLTKAGKVLAVEPKAFRALLFLLRNPQKVVSKEEVLNSVWGDVAVGDGSLTRCIWLLRTLLGEDIRNPRYIETVATVGYRFICPVEVLEGAAEGVAGTHPETPSIPPAEFDSLAVLPFFTSGSSPDAEYLADGITETLINQFAQLQHLKVIARSTVFRHKQKDVDPIEVGRSLGVSTVLTGRIFQRDDVLVIAAELINVRDGLQLWGQQYKRQITDIFSIEEEISREISERLRVRFAPGQSRLGKRYTENPVAYQLYLKGRFAWNKRTIEGMRQALSLFEQAVETDPSYARAYAGLADCTSMLAIYGDLDPVLANRRAKAAQEMALQIDPELSEAYASRGFRLLHLDWDFRAGEKELRQALDLNPGYASANQWLGMALGLTGRLEEARCAMRMAQQLDPFSASINTTAVFPMYWARLFDEAIEGFRTAIELHPGYWMAPYYLGLSYAQEGDFGPAILSLRHAAEIGDSPQRYSGLGYVYARAGERERAESVLQMLNELGRQRYVPAIYSAAVYVGLGNFDQAFACLRRAVERRDWMIAWFHVDPLWDMLRSDSRLRDLQADFGLKL